MQTLYREMFTTVAYGNCHTSEQKVHEITSGTSVTVGDSGVHFCVTFQLRALINSLVC